MTDARRRRHATIGILFGMFAGALDATLVGTSMPTIVARLGGISIYFLAFSVFLLTYVVSVPVFGRLSDLYGRRRLHLLGVLIFVAASMLCGLSKTMTHLILFRGFQGIGAGCLVALSFTMIGDLYPLPERAKMQGAIGGLWGLASLIGPIAGGLITHHLGWPWVFYVMVPIAALSAVIVQASWEDVRPAEVRRLDIPGAVLLTLAGATFVTALTLLGRGGSWRLPVGLFGAAAVFTAALVFVERKSSSPFLSYDLFRIRLFAWGAFAGCAAMACLFATTSFIPLYVQGVLGESPMRAGLTLVAMMIPWVILSGASGHLLLRVGYRPLAVAGMVLVTAGYAALARLGPESPWIAVALPLLFVGAGLGITLPPLLMAAQNAVNRDQMGAATSLTQFTRTMGGMLGVAIMGAILTATLAAQGPRGEGMPGPDAVVDPIVRSGLAPEVRELWRIPLWRGLQRIFVVGAALAGLGIVLALRIPGGRPTLPNRV